MLAYVEELCESEGVTVESGVLPLVVRAGGGSPRDTLSLLDQLIAGSEGPVVAYKRAVSLLGYTHAELLDEVVDAFAGADASAAFSAIDRVIQTGQDPRRFVDDLLERLRDLIIVSATGEGAAAVLRGVSAEDLQRMSRQAGALGTARLSHIADLVIATLDDMTGATSPRLQLELMVARVLASALSGAGTVTGVRAGAGRCGGTGGTWHCRACRCCACRCCACRCCASRCRAAAPAPAVVAPPVVSTPGSRSRPEPDASPIADPPVAHRAPQRSDPAPMLPSRSSPRPRRHRAARSLCSACATRGRRCSAASRRSAARRGSSPPVPRSPLSTRTC